MAHFIPSTLSAPPLKNTQFFSSCKSSTFPPPNQALVNFDAILLASDGIMVARGDLGVEIPMETLCNVQKDLVRRSNLAGTRTLDRKFDSHNSFIDFFKSFTDPFFSSIY